jgi:hypothetical protein
MTMPQEIEKNIPTEKLKEQLRGELAQFALTDRRLKAQQGPIMEQQPVAENIERIVKIVKKLQGRGEQIRIPINLAELHPDLRTMLEINPEVGTFFQQAALKEHLLKKHGREKLARYKARARRLPRPRLP